MASADNPTHVLAADIGGTHITAAIIRTSDWKILEDTVVREHIDSSAPVDKIIQDWAKALKASQDLTPEKNLPIGIAMPGPFDYENGISLIKGQGKYDALYKINVKEKLAKALNRNTENIKLINDAAAFLQGEVFVGKFDHLDKVLGITLGTGLGSAIWEHGKDATDANLWDTPYRDGIMEEHLVTRYFVREMKERAGVSVTGLRELLTLRDSHDAVEGILKDFSEHLHFFIDYFTKRENTKTVILGGNISRAWPIFKSFDEEAFAKFNIQQSKIAEHAALIGASSLFR